MQIKIRHSLNGKIFWGLWLIPSLLFTIQFFLLGIQNLRATSYFIIFPIMLLFLLLSYLLFFFLRPGEPILIEGDNLTITESFSMQRKTFPLSQIINVTIYNGLTGASVRLMDENGVNYTVRGLNPQDVLALKDLATLHML